MYRRSLVAALVRVAITGCGSQPRDYSLGDIGDGTEGGELESPPPSKMNRDQRGEAVEQLLECVGIPDIRCSSRSIRATIIKTVGSRAKERPSIWGRALATGWT